MMFGLVSYKPWIQIGNTDHNNPFSVVVDGVRKTVESKKCEYASDGEERAAVKQKVVWFFGGSTTFRQGVPWWDTIPSKFVEEAEGNGVCVVAVNFGVPFHFSRQEAMNFSSRLMKEQRTPDAVVFLDGLNDLMFPGSAIRSEPFFTPTLYKLVPVSDNPSTITRINPPAAGFLSGLSAFFRDLHVLKWVGLSRGADAEREEACKQQ